MKEYSETLSSIYAKAGIIAEKRGRRIAAARRITASVSGMCAALLIGIGLRSSDLRSGMDDIGVSSPVVGETQPPDEPTNAPVAPVTSASTSAVTETSAASQTSGTAPDTTTKATSAAESSAATTSTRPLPHGEVTSSVTAPPELPLTGRYSSFELGGGRFTAMGENTVVAADELAEKIAENTFPDGRRADVFRLKNYSPDAALAVRFEGYDELYFYVNCAYSPQSFRSWATDLRLDSSALTGRGKAYRYSPQFEVTDFELADKDALWEELLRLEIAENCEENGGLADVREVYFAVEKLGISGTVRICADGLVEITGSAGNGGFFVGEDAAERLMGADFYWR